MTTAFKELCAVAKTKPKAGEDFIEFAKRLTDKINNVADAEWQSLGDGSTAQTWHNDAMTAFTARKNAKAEAKKNAEDEEAAVDAVAIPELEGYEEVPGKDDQADSSEVPTEEKDASADDVVDTEPGEVTAVKPAKVKKKKNVPKAKPEKKEKPVKSAKVAKAPKPEKVVKEKKAKPVKKEGETRGRRAAYDDSAGIKLLVEENPHRKGTILYKYFDKYKDGMTVTAALQAGIPRANLRYFAKIGEIKIK